MRRGNSRYTSNPDVANTSRKILVLPGSHVAGDTRGPRPRWVAPNGQGGPRRRDALRHCDTGELPHLER